MAGGYKELEAGAGYLKNIDPLVDDAQDGITQDDFDDAEVQARARIDAVLAPLYTVSTWTASPPPLVAVIADKLASAKILTNKFARDSGGNSLLAEILEKEAQEFLDMIRDGRMAVVTSAGTLVASRAYRTPVVDNG